MMLQKVYFFLLLESILKDLIDCDIWIVIINHRQDLYAEKDCDADLE